MHYFAFIFCTESYRVSDCPNVKPQEVGRVEVVLVSSNLEEVCLLIPDSVEESIVPYTLLWVQSLLL